MDDAEVAEAEANVGFSVQLEMIQRLGKDLRKASATLSPGEARFLVDLYYQIQEDRKRSASQVRTLEEGKEPNAVLLWFQSQFTMLEDNIKKALDAFSRGSPVGVWAREQKGIGPVIAAGLLAYLEESNPRTAGQFWSFAGLNPNSMHIGRVKSNALVKEVLGKVKRPTIDHVREVANRINRNPERFVESAKNKEGNYTATSIAAAGAKRPWNTALKTLCWKVGESFMKNSTRDAYYGDVYAMRRAQECERNEKGQFADQARDGAERVGRATDSWPWYAGCFNGDEIKKLRLAGEAGTDWAKKAKKGEPGSGTLMLPPGHILARAKRYAAKLFIAHLFEVWYENKHDKKPPLPYPIAHMGHSNYVPPPGK